MPNQGIKSGSIVWAEVCDPVNGDPAGEHAGVVLNPQIEIDNGEDLRIAVCTTSFSYPLRSGCFAMPNVPGGQRSDVFTDATVVKATWLQKIKQSDVNSVADKRAPMRIVREIIHWLSTHRP